MVWGKGTPNLKSNKQRYGDEEIMSGCWTEVGLDGLEDMSLEAKPKSTVYSLHRGLVGRSVGFTCPLSSPQRLDRCSPCG